MEHFTPSLIALTVMAVLIIVVVWSWHRDKDSNFQLQQVIVDNTTNKISIEKVGYMTALAIGSWGFVALTLNDKLSEWYAMAYLGAFVIGRLGSSGISVWKDKNGN